MTDDMKSKFNKYWDEASKILLVALLLVPRYKLIDLFGVCFMKVFGEEVPNRNANAALVWFKAYYSYYESLLQGVPVCGRSLYKGVPHKALW